MPDLVIRPAVQDDVEVLWDFLAMAAYEPDAEAAKAVPFVAKYLVGWQRPGDFGFIAEQGTGSVEWERLPILKQSLIQTPVQFSRDPYVVEIPGRMGICMPYVVYPINASRVFVRELCYIQIA